MTHGRKKEGKREIQKFEYLQNEESFLDEKNNNNFLRAITGLSSSVVK